jgi:hypothetical protein
MGEGLRLTLQVRGRSWLIHEGCRRNPEPGRQRRSKRRHGFDTFSSRILMHNRQTRCQHVVAGPWRFNIKWSTRKDRARQDTSANNLTELFARPGLLGHCATTGELQLAGIWDRPRSRPLQLCREISGEIDLATLHFIWPATVPIMSSGPWTTLKLPPDSTASAASPAPAAGAAASIFDVKAHCGQHICATALWRRTVFFPAHIIAQIDVSAVEFALGVSAGGLKWQPATQDSVPGLVVQILPTRAHDIMVGGLSRLVSSRVPDLDEHTFSAGSAREMYRRIKLTDSDRCCSFALGCTRGRVGHCTAARCLALQPARWRRQLPNLHHRSRAKRQQERTRGRGPGVPHGRSGR